MFSDPLSFVTTGVVTGSSLARTGSSDSSGAFANATDGLTLQVSHRYTKGRAQRLFRIDKQVLEANLLVSAQNQAQTASVWVACDVPLIGTTSTLTPTYTKDLAVVTFGLLTASTNANLVKFMNGES